MENYLGSFLACDRYKNEYEIQMYDGPAKLKTSNGRIVERLEKGKYQIADFEIELFCDDPDAP